MQVELFVVVDEGEVYSDDLRSPKKAIVNAHQSMLESIKTAVNLATGQGLVK